MTEYLVDALNKNGFDASVVLTRGRFSDKSVVNSLPEVPYRFLQPTEPKMKAVWHAFTDAVRAPGRRIIVPQYDYAISAISASLPTDIGIVGIAHADDAEHYEHIYRVGRYWNRIVAVSEAIKRGIGDVHPLLGQRAVVIRNGVPVYDKAISKPKGTIKLVFAGRISRFQKRIYDYVRLAELLASNNVDFHMSLIGDGEELENVRRQLGRLIKTGHVDLPGRKTPSEIFMAFDQAHVLLLLSDFEGLPMSLLEAMERGCVPLVYEMASGIPEIVTNGQNGFIVNKGDMASLVKLIQTLATDQAMLTNLSKRARRTISEKGVTQKIMADRYAELFNSVLEETAAGLALPRKALTHNSPLGEALLPPMFYPKDLGI